MKWSETEYEDYLRRQKEHRRRIGQPEQVMTSLGTSGLSELASHTVTKPRAPNKTEAEYARNYLEPRRLAGEVVSYEYEAIKLRLADKCWYNVDWLAVRADGAVEAHEIKGGHTWDDAVVKFKVARRLFPWLRFVWARKQKGTWSIREYQPSISPT